MPAFDVITVQHDVTGDSDTVSGTRLKGHGGADFFAIDAFVHAVSVCIELLAWRVCNNM